MTEIAIHQDRERAAGFDLLRITTACGVVLLHAAAPYLVHPMPGLVWPVSDRPSMAAEWLGWSAEFVVMPIFLLMAGYFAAVQLQRWEPRPFLKNRFSRLLLPLVCLGPIILTFDLYVWLGGWLIEGRIEPRKLQSLKFDEGQGLGLWGLSHLWFLTYVFLYCLILASVWRPWSRWLTASVGRSHTTLITCVVISLAMLAVYPQTVFGFQHAFLPVLPKWLFCGSFFFAGGILALVPNCASMLQRKSALFLLAGGLAILAGVPLGGLWMEQSDAFALAEAHADPLGWQYLIPFGGWGLARWLSVVAAAAAGWCVAIGGTTLAMRSRLRSGRVVQYLAAASFWIYLVHHPLMGLAHIQLKVLLPVGVSPLLKLGIATGEVLLLCLLSFDLIARRRPLDRLLGLPSWLRKSSKAAQENATVAMPHPSVDEPAHQPSAQPAASVESRPQTHRKAG